MTAVTIVALALAIPIMLIPVALVWYINIGGIMLAVKEAREKRVARQKVTVKA
ncbi:MAG: hypothetical protein V1932_05700 [Chloroflexota bacterium]